MRSRRVRAGWGSVEAGCVIPSVVQAAVLMVLEPIRGKDPACGADADTDRQHRAARNATWAEPRMSCMSRSLNSGTGICGVARRVACESRSDGLGWHHAQ